MHLRLFKFLKLSCPMFEIYSFTSHTFAQKRIAHVLKHFMGCLIKRKIQPHFFGLLDGQLKVERGALSSYPLEFLSKK